MTNDGRRKGKEEEERERGRKGDVKEGREGALEPPPKSLATGLQ